MGAGFAVVAGSLICALGLAAAQTAPETARMQTSPKTATTGKVATPQSMTDLSKSVRPTGAMQSTPSGTSALTATECTNMDGTVETNQYSEALCASKKLCVRTDNKGKQHAMCLEQ